MTDLDRTRKHLEVLADALTTPSTHEDCANCGHPSVRHRWAGASFVCDPPECFCLHYCTQAEVEEARRVF
jgi:hypothetical protein